MVAVMVLGAVIFVSVWYCRGIWQQFFFFLRFINALLLYCRWRSPTARSCSSEKPQNEKKTAGANRRRWLLILLHKMHAPDCHVFTAVYANLFTCLRDVRAGHF